jgi:hypothetical protein
MCVVSAQSCLYVGHVARQHTPVLPYGVLDIDKSTAAHNTQHTPLRTALHACHAVGNGGDREQIKGYVGEDVQAGSKAHSLPPTKSRLLSMLM